MYFKNEYLNDKMQFYLQMTKKIINCNVLVAPVAWIIRNPDS